MDARKIVKINRQLKARNQKLRTSASRGDKSNQWDHPNQVEPSYIDEFRRLYAEGKLPEWKIRRLEQIPGWTWTEAAHEL